jgi:hypothetical protein
MHLHIQLHVKEESAILVLAFPFLTNEGVLVRAGFVVPCAVLVYLHTVFCIPPVYPGGFWWTPILEGHVQICVLPSIITFHWNIISSCPCAATCVVIQYIYTSWQYIYRDVSMTNSGVKISELLVCFIWNTSSISVSTYMFILFSVLYRGGMG